MQNLLSAQQPWPGLATYEEDARAWFFGRDNEAEALLRLIRMAPLTVLYGRSGLGKSSLLKAGLFPRLREQAMLPVYLRLDFSAQASEDPMAQMARRLDEEILAAGLEAPPRDADETLWHWLHRRDFELWSADNKPWTPVLVLDQFEELFSRSSGDPARTGALFDQLADLAENRIPQDVAAQRDGRSTLDLLSQRYRMVLSFREDFLPELRAWERKLPSLLRNDLRLVAMTRAQAIGAAQQAGSAVLAPGVAERLVDFVGGLGVAAGPSTIEPALLSLCGAELVRRAPDGRIDAELLATAGQDILEGFYRGALADMPDSVHVFIEERLLQGDRTRGSYAREEALTQGFITREQLARLTDQRRLLRIEQEGGVPRIELIHDRLVEVVRRARERRAALRHAEAEREQERRDAAERLAREQAERLRSEEVARARAEADAAQLRRVRRRLIVALAAAVLWLGAAMWQTWQAQKASQRALDAAQRAEQERIVATVAKNAAIESARLAQERLTQSSELLRSRYGWVGDWPEGSSGTDRVQEALRAEQALQQVRRDSPALALAVRPGTASAGRASVTMSSPAPAPSRAPVRIELFAKDLDQALVNQALQELGYPVLRPRALVGDTATNALWFGSAVPLQDVRVVALALIRAGVKLRAIRPIQDSLVAKKDLPLIQVGADKGVLDQPPYTVEQVLKQARFER